MCLGNSLRPYSKNSPPSSSNVVELLENLALRRLRHRVRRLRRAYAASGDASRLVPPRQRLQPRHLPRAQRLAPLFSRSFVSGTSRPRAPTVRRSPAPSPPRSPAATRSRFSRPPRASASPAPARRPGATPGARTVVYFASPPRRASARAPTPARTRAQYSSTASSASRAGRRDDRGAPRARASRAPEALVGDERRRVRMPSTRRDSRRANEAEVRTRSNGRRRRNGSKSDAGRAARPGREARRDRHRGKLRWATRSQLAKINNKRGARAEALTPAARRRPRRGARPPSRRRARARARASASSILARACDRASARRAPSSVETSSSASAALASSASRDASVDALAASRAGRRRARPGAHARLQQRPLPRQLALERRANLIADLSRPRQPRARLVRLSAPRSPRRQSPTVASSSGKTSRRAFATSRSRRRRASFAVAAHRHGLERARVARGRRFQSRDHRARRVVAHRAANCRAG